MLHLTWQIKLDAHLELIVLTVTAFNSDSLGTSDNVSKSVVCISSRQWKRNRCLAKPWIFS